MTIFGGFCPLLVILGGDEYFFQKRLLSKELGFIALCSVQQTASLEVSKTAFTQFFKLFIKSGDPYDFGW